MFPTPRRNISTAKISMTRKVIQDNWLTSDREKLQRRKSRGAAGQGQREHRPHSRPHRAPLPFQDAGSCLPRYLRGACSGKSTGGRSPYGDGSQTPQGPWAGDPAQPDPLCLESVAGEPDFGSRQWRTNLGGQPVPTGRSPAGGRGWCTALPADKSRVRLTAQKPELHSRQSGSREATGGEEPALCCLRNLCRCLLHHATQLAADRSWNGRGRDQGRRAWQMCPSGQGLPGAAKALC